MEIEVGGPSRGQALVRELTARCLPGSADPNAGRRILCDISPAAVQRPDQAAVQLRVFWSLDSETREDLPLETPVGVSDALTRLFFLFFFWRGGSSCCRDLPPTLQKRLLLPSMPESFRPFSRTGITALLSQLLSVCTSHLCLGLFLFLMLQVVSAAACSGWGNLPPSVPRAQGGWEQDLRVMAASLDCVSFISSLGGERANFRLSPPLFSAPSHLDWLTF